jgi:hypothetical protein
MFKDQLRDPQSEKEEKGVLISFRLSMNLEQTVVSNQAWQMGRFATNP